MVWSLTKYDNMFPLSSFLNLCRNAQKMGLTSPNEKKKKLRDFTTPLVISHHQRSCLAS